MAFPKPFDPPVTRTDRPLKSNCLIPGNMLNHHAFPDPKGKQVRQVPKIFLNFVRNPSFGDASAGYS
jgi:hypothetical protein